MNWLKQWWRDIRRAIDADVDAHIAKITAHSDSREELSALIDELEGITERLRKLI